MDRGAINPHILPRQWKAHHGQLVARQILEKGHIVHQGLRKIDALPKEQAMQPQMTSMSIA
jgi:hypothetical protein